MPKSKFHEEVPEGRVGDFFVFDEPEAPEQEPEAHPDERDETEDE